jgi:uncharacterized protein (TIGR02996 family)
MDITNAVSQQQESKNPTLHAMLSELLSNPGDTTLRLIVADALDEHLPLEHPQKAKISLLRSEHGWWEIEYRIVNKHDFKDFYDGKAYSRYFIKWIVGDGKGPPQGFAELCKTQFPPPCTGKDCKHMPTLRSTATTTYARPPGKIRCGPRTDWKWLCSTCYNKLKQARKRGDQR